MSASPSASGRLSLPWSVVALAGLLCVGADLSHTPLPGGVAPSLLVGVVALGAGGLRTLTTRTRTERSQSGPITPWLLLDAALALVLAGTLVGRLDERNIVWVVGGGVLALTGYPMAAVGLRRLLVQRIARPVDALVEAGLIAVTAGLAIWVSFAGPDGGFGSHWTSVALLHTALCSLDIGLLALAGRLLVAGGPSVTPDRLLCSTFGLLLLSHAALAFTSPGPTGHSSLAAESLLTAALICWGLARSHRDVHRRGERDALDPGGFSHGHAAIVAVCLLVSPTVMGIQAHRHAIVSPAIAIGAGLLELVMAAYVTTLLWDRAVTEHQAQHDHLTRLPNAMLFRDRVQRAIAHARRNGGMAAVMFLDLDYFKHINDSLGHAAGDDLLRQVAERLTGSLRDEDTVARLGGDEFAVLLPDLKEFDGAIVVAQKLVRAITAPFTLEGRAWALTPSVGIAAYPSDGDDAAELVANADTAMYRVKEAGRNGYEVFNASLHLRAQERAELELALHNAIERSELIVYYQPKIDLKGGAIVGAEALVRWQHPDRGLIPPAEFIPLAEQTGQIVRLGEVVMYEACRQAKEWQVMGLAPIPIAVNVSARQFSAGITDVTASVLRRTALDPRCLEVELTESAAAEGLDVIAGALDELKSMGVRCAIDDFGTGYCSLSYLSRLPIDALKIDRSFVELMSNERDASIVAAIISMAHSLKMKVVAEGVETTDQWQALARFGCEEVQGYLFSQPVPADEFERLLRRQATGPIETTLAPATKNADPLNRGVEPPPLSMTPETSGGRQIFQATG